MIFEICADNLETAMVGSTLGCNRVELCSALTIGGLTPSFGLIKACAEATDLEIHAMIRHQEGNFVLNDTDLEIMKSDIVMAKNAGAVGVVFGCLTVYNEVDIEKLKVLVDLAKSIKLVVTFHRAFDFVSDPLKSINELIDLSIDRVLTSGQKSSAENGVDLIRELVEFSNNRIEVMAGSGVNVNNALLLAEAGVDSLHFTAYINSESNLSLGMGSKNMPDIDKIKSILNLF
ncbi:MAG: copper homeostasis protein CutC [Crocinitomicaceae bacterium]